MLFYIAKVYLVGILSSNASFRIFEEMIKNLFKRKMSFFDTTPSGVILNRCVDDIEIVDYEYALNLKDVSEALFSVLGALSMTVFGSLLMVPILIAITFRVGSYFRRYIGSSVELKRLYRISRSRVFSCASEAINGHSSIRTYGYELAFMEKWKNAHNLSIRVLLHERLAKYVIIYQLYAIVDVVNVFVWIIFFFQKITGFGFFVGINTIALVLASTTSINLMVYSFSTKMSEFINNTSVVERLEEYCNWDDFEADFDEPLLQKQWPTDRKISIKRLSLRYREGLPLVLKGLDFEIEGGSKVGVVGRTGSGKSTLLLGLMRILEAAVDEDGDPLGEIEIDGVDISTIGLHLLRRNIKVIPQDPILLEGTIRSNIDPMEELEDGKILEIVDKTDLFEAIKGGKTNSKDRTDDERKNFLGYKIEQRGSNLSLGQRQLVCIARALASEPKILLMDEATASIDEKSDRTIQKVIKHELITTTVITIAHRLDTVIQYDKILVLRDGLKIEEGSPSELLLKRGHFYEMVGEGGEGYLQKMILMSGNKALNLGSESGSSQDIEVDDSSLEG